MQPDFTGFFHQPTNTVSYVVADPETAACAVIDSVLDYDQDAARTGTAHADLLVAHIRGHRLRLEWILETHVHADHLGAEPAPLQRVEPGVAADVENPLRDRAPGEDLAHFLGRLVGGVERVLEDLDRRRVVEERIQRHRQWAPRPARSSARCPCSWVQANSRIQVVTGTS